MSDHVAWLRYGSRGDRPVTIHLCDSDSFGAFPVYPPSALAAKDAEIADMLTTICEQQDEIEALREREETHDAGIARLRNLVKRLADRLVTRGHSERSQEYCTDCALVAEARKESP